MEVITFVPFCRIVSCPLVSAACRPADCRSVRRTETQTRPDRGPRASGAVVGPTAQSCRLLISGDIINNEARVRDVVVTTCAGEGPV